MAAPGPGCAFRLSAWPHIESDKQQPLKGGQKAKA